jgi:hypothetical protein
MMSSNGERAEMNLRERVEVAEQFLRELGRGIPDDERVMVGYAKEATVQRDAEGKKLNAGWWPVAWKDGKYIQSGVNCYVCISSSIKTANPRTGEMRYWRGEASFGHGLALMVDDIGSGRGSKGGLTVDAISAILKPTAIVETSPGNFQAWYFLDKPCADMVYFKAFLVGFVANVLESKGGDTTIRDVSRYGRMPVGINNKRKDDGELKYPIDGGAALVGLVYADYTKRYSIEHIASRFGFTFSKPAKLFRSDAEQRALDAENSFNALWLAWAVKILDRLHMGEGSGGAVVQNMSGKYRIQCPWGEQHANGDASGAYFRDRIPGAEYDYVFGCAHDTCRKQHRRTWSVFVDHVVINQIAYWLAASNAAQLEFDLSDYKEIA